MRKILFKGKRIDNGAWVYGDLIWADYIPARAWISSPDDGNRLRGLDTGSKTAEWRGIEVDPETVGQYTGLTDKNGQKIFEGDIIHWDWEKVPYLVYWSDKTCQFTTDMRWLWSSIENVEILGNIHDNPELVDGKEYQYGIL